jgi:heme O synthase-like polyprenyltransferase
MSFLAQIREWDDPDDSCMVNGVPTIGCLEIIFGNILYMSSILIVLVLFVMFVIGAYMYMTSLGNSEKMEKAKNTFMYAIIGLVVFVSAFVILFTIDILFLGGEGKIFELNFNIGGP